MEISFKKYLEQNVPGPHLDGNRSGISGAFVSSDQTGSETWRGNIPYHPSYELLAQIVPHDVKYGRVSQIKEYQPPKKTLVQIRLDTHNGSETFYLNTDEYRIVQKLNAGRKPAVGDMMTVPILRLPGDHTSKAIIMGMRY